MKKQTKIVKIPKKKKKVGVKNLIKRQKSVREKIDKMSENGFHGQLFFSRGKKKNAGWEPSKKYENRASFPKHFKKMAVFFKNRP